MAQSKTVVGGNSLARECYERSQVATSTESASRQDLKVCDTALSDESLNTRDLVATYVNRGIIYTAMEQYSQAARDYNRALSISGDVGEAYLNRGNLWFVARQYVRAIEDYDNALKYGIMKTHVAFLNRGMALENNKDLLRAKKNYLEALEIIPEWEPALQKLARVNLKIEKQQ